MENKENILGFTLAIGAIVLAFYAPFRIIEESKIAVIGAIIIFYILVTVFRFNSRLNYRGVEQKRLEEKLKIHEQLIDIKSDIKDLQREVFKK